VGRKTAATRLLEDIPAGDLDTVVHLWP